MKRTTYILLVAGLLIAVSGMVMGQTELLENGGFESWDDTSTPAGWDHIESITQEATEVRSGSYSAKHVGGTKDLGQYIAVTGGKSYTVTLWYKVTAGDGTDARIWSYWRSSGSNLDDNASELRGPNNSYFDNNGGVWTQYTVTLDAPLSADEFYFEVRTYSGATVYWDDFSFLENSVSSDPEPTNHVSSFSASLNGYSAIDLTWLDNDGTDVALGFLILANTSGSFTDPVDGTPQADDTDLSDGSGVKNIAHGVQSYTFTGLTAETTYYFKIYPYSNVSENINYKTEGDVPSASATTETLPNAWINEIHYDNDGSDVNEGVEIIIENPGDYTLSSFTVTLYNGNGGASYGSETLDNFTVGNSQGDFTIYYNTSAWGSGIQNGAPDGLALSYQGHLIQFLSYEGTFTATDGPANGITSTDIGVSQSGSDPVGETLQLIGGGTQYSDFTWGSSTYPATWGAPNNDGSTDQSLPVELNGFNAVPGNGEVTLSWTTESETENLGFIIQRRQETTCLTAQSGQGEWKLVADYTTDETLAGQGSTSEAHEYTYTDAQVVPGATYLYRLGDVDYSGKVTWHKEVEVKVEVEDEQVPVVFSLKPAYPNPFNPETTLRFQLGEASHVRVQVYDLLGNLVTTLTDGRYQVGRYNLHWNGCDDRGRLSSSGVYFIYISSSTGFTSTQKVVFLR
ncbi:MAG: T9SS type A sorting domain-containing protein [Fidelibacterota bacterium]